MKKQWLEICVVLLIVVAGCAERALPLQEPEVLPDGAVDGSAPAKDDMGNDDDDATLIDLEISQGALSPIFAPLQTTYTTREPLFVEVVTLTPTAKSSKATIMVNGQPVLSGTASQAIPLSFGMNPLTVEVTTLTAKKSYDLLVTRDSSIEFITEPSSPGNGLFGYRVALSGDTLAIGVDSDVTAGVVYVFTRSGTAWIEQAQIKGSNSERDDHFGRSVALSNDTLAVGAPLEESNATGVNGNQADNSAKQSGAVYIFIRAGTQWTQQAYVKASNTGGATSHDPFFGDGFGWSVALFGDTLAVGAPFEDSSATGVNGDQSDNSAKDSGAVYVFTRAGTQWTQQAYVKASNTEGNNNSIEPFGDAFGWSVALFGDTLAVGAPYEDSSATGVDGNQADNSAFMSGAAYVFTRSGATWTQQTYVKASNRSALFGLDLSLSSDTLAVGALQEGSSATGVNADQSDDSAPASGAAYIFIRDGTQWTQQAYLKASNTNADDLFGASVALFGNTLAVGAPREDSSATGVGGDQTDNSALDSGAVYVFVRSGGAWTQQAYVKASNTAESLFDDLFGLSVALSADTLVVGAPYETRPSSPGKLGAVYVY